MAKGKVLVFSGASALSLALAMALAGCASWGDDVSVDVASFTNRSLLQAVTRITDDGMLKSHPAVAPDGSKLLYTEIKADTGESNIMLLRNVNSSAKTPLVTTGNAYTPGWFGDSTRFLYSLEERDSSRIVRSSSAGGGRTNITRNPVGGADMFPAIRDGVILIQTWEGGAWRIYSMRENGSEITRLGDGFDPAWHPYDLKFLYVKGNPSGIWEMDLATTQETLLYDMPPFNIRRPQYTADGRFIVFQRGSEQMVSGVQVTGTKGFFGNLIKSTFTNTSGTEVRWQLFSITSDGMNESVLTEGNVDCYWPTLDVDNNLYFISNATGVNSNKTEIYKARLNFE